MTHPYKPAIEKILRMLMWLASPPLFMSAIAGLAWAMSAGWVPPVAGTLVAAAYGVLAGSRCALWVSSHTIIHHPDVIRDTVEEWQADGRWGRLMADIARRRRAGKAAGGWNADDQPAGRVHEGSPGWTAGKPHGPGGSDRIGR